MSKQSKNVQLVRVAVLVSEQGKERRGREGEEGAMYRVEECGK